MDERTRITWMAIAGAAIGSAIGYLLFTDRGRKLRAELSPTIDGLIKDAVELGSTVQKARSAAAEGLSELRGLVGDLRRDDDGRPTNGVSH